MDTTKNIFYKLFLYVSLISILVGCSVASSTEPTNKVITPTKIDPVTTAPSIDTATPFFSKTSTAVEANRVTPARTSKAAPPFGNDAHVRVNCIEISNFAGDEVKREGVIFFESMQGIKSPIGINVKTGEQFSLRINWSGDNWMVSPDRSLFLQIPEMTENPQLTWQVLTADGEIKGAIILEKAWWGYEWMDNQTILFAKETSQGSLVYEAMAVNPFTGQQQNLPFDYPDLYTFFTQRLYLPVKYDPGLSRVVYPAATFDEGGFVIRDIAHQKNLGMVTANPLMSEPKWSPDGTHFIVAGIPEGEENLFEFFTMDREGNIAQVSHLTDHYYQQSIINKFSWSPDGRAVAFWFTGAPSDPSDGEHLAVLDVENQEVTNFCIPGFGQPLVEPPIWSPDGKQVVVQSYDKQQNERAILVDIEHEVAVELGKNIDPDHWLTDQPGVWLSQ